MITFDSKDDSDIQKPLPPLPKLTGTDPSSASKSLISFSDVTANMTDLTLNTASKEIKKSNKVSQTCVIKKRTESKHPAIQNSCLNKNALPSTEQLLLTLMEEVKGIKNQILIPSDTSLLVSQSYSSKTPKQKVRKMENLNEVRVKELRSNNGTEFRIHKPKEFYDEKGISQTFSSPCTPEQNGVAERRNTTPDF
nr:putative ribonuclease H-like domain-containing protein [Tanacetum cinerariifolium]